MLKNLWIVIVILLVASVNIASARVITVPTDYSTIQGGINAADENGDTVFVLSGGYTASLISITGVPGQELFTLMGAGMDSTLIIGGRISVDLPIDSDLDSVFIVGLTIVATGPGRGISYWPSAHPRHIFIRSCRFNGLEYGVDISGGCCHLSKNVFDLCTWGICTHDFGKVEIINNTFAWNYVGIRIGDPAAPPGDPVIENNIIINSETYGIDLAYDSNGFGITPRYNDVWNSGSSDYHDCEPSEGSISVDPLVVGVEGGDYHLTESSPCIDAGNPEILDSDSSIGDMGAFPYLGASIDFKLFLPAKIEFSVSPNPFNTSTTISFELPESGPVSLQIFDTQGRLVTELVSGDKEAGIHTTIWDAKNVPSGIYFASLITGSENKSIRMTLIK